MKIDRVKDGRDGRIGWKFRFTDPVTRRRTHKTIRLAERREAEKAFGRFLERREARKFNLPDHSCWQMPYRNLVGKFLKEADISSEDRRGRLEAALGRNDLRVEILSDFCDLGKLTARCLKLVRERSDIWVIKNVQQPLKQLSAWAASNSLLPHDPLAPWKRVRRTSTPRQRRAFRPEEMNAILAAAEERDVLLGRSCPMAIVFKSLLLTGNRPGAVLAAKVADLEEERIVLPPGRGKKRNGKAFLPPPFMHELRQYVAKRGKADANAPLLASPEGSKLPVTNASHEFTRCMILAFVKKCWPADDPLALEADPHEVSDLVYTKRLRGFDGAPPRDPAKLAKRARRAQATEAIASRIEAKVARLLKGRDMYALKSTHVSWARRLVHPDSVKLQVGHAPKGVQERHYLDWDLVDARESAQAVWDVLTGKRFLSGGYRRRRSLPVAVGAEGMAGGPDPGQAVDPELDPTREAGETFVSEEYLEGAQVRCAPEVDAGGPGRIRTSNLGIMSPLL